MIIITASFVTLFLNWYNNRLLVYKHTGDNGLLNTKRSLQDVNAAKLFSDEAAVVYERATASLLKKNMLLYFAYADFEEGRLKYEKVHQIYSRYLDMEDVDPTLVSANRCYSVIKLSLLFTCDTHCHELLSQLVQALLSSTVLSVESYRCFGGTASIFKVEDEAIQETSVKQVASREFQSHMALAPPCPR
jgi:hypothetical protein